MKWAAVVVAALSLAACTPQQVEDNEARARQVLTSIRNGARVAAADIKVAIDGLCANGPAVAAGASVVKLGLGTQSGPNTSQDLSNVDRAMAALGRACDRAATNPNDPALKSLLSTAWQEYQIAKMSAQAAQGGN